MTYPPSHDPAVCTLPPVGPASQPAPTVLAPPTAPQQVVSLQPPPWILRPCRVEKLHPNIDWPNVWVLARQKYLESDLTSFLFKLLHHLLPTGDRVNHILPNSSPYCTYCIKHGEDVADDLEHTFFRCRQGREVGELLVKLVSGQVDKPAGPQHILQLNISCETSLQFPLVWLISAWLFLMWERRRKKQSCKREEIVSDVKSKLSIRNQGQPANSGTILNSILCLNI